MFKRVQKQKHIQNERKTIDRAKNSVHFVGKVSCTRFVRFNTPLNIYHSIGIIGKSYSDFDLIRLTLKPNKEDTISIPGEFLMSTTNKRYDYLISNVSVFFNEYDCFCFLIYQAHYADSAK